MKQLFLLVVVVFGCSFWRSSEASAGSIAGHLLVADYDIDTGSQTFWTVDPATGAKVRHGTAAIGGNNDGMGFSGGKLYVAQDQDFRLLEVDLESGAYSVIASGIHTFGNIKDLAVASDGGLWIFGSSLSRIDPVTYNQAPYYNNMWNGPGGLYNSWYIATEASGMMVRSFLGSINDGDGGISRLDPATGIETLLASGMDNAKGLAVAEDGSIYVVEEQGYGGRYLGVHRIDPVTGEETLVTTDPRLGSDHGDLTWVPGHGLFKSNYDSVLSIDVDTGEVSTLATFSGYLSNHITVVSVPEPASAGLLAFGGLLLMGRDPKEVQARR